MPAPRNLFIKSNTALNNLTNDESDRVINAEPGEKREADDNVTFKVIRRLSEKHQKL